MSDDYEFDRSSVIVSERWRFTGVPTTVAGLHSSILLGLPAMIPAAWMGMFKPVAFGWLVYAGLIYYLNAKWKITPFEWVRMMITRFVKGNKWRVR